MLSIAFITGSDMFKALKHLRPFNLLDLMASLALFVRVVFIVTDLIKALPGNSSVNTSTGKNRRETVLYAVRAGRAHGDVGSLLPGNEAVNMQPQQWETVLSVGSVQRSYLKDERRYESVSSRYETATGSS
jgi:hypothetical protein